MPTSAEVTPTERKKEVMAASSSTSAEMPASEKTREERKGMMP